MTQNEIVTAIGFSIGFLESELPYPVAPNRLSEFEREVWQAVRALRALHRQLSPVGNKLAAVGNGVPFKKQQQRKPAGEFTKVNTLKRGRD